MAFLCPQKQIIIYQAVLHYVNQKDIDQLQKYVDICINQKLFQKHTPTKLNKFLEDNLQVVKSNQNVVGIENINSIEHPMDVKQNQMHQFYQNSALIQQQIKYKQQNIAKRQITFPQLSYLIFQEYYKGKLKQERVVVKMTKKSEYHNLLLEFKGQKWTDHQFDQKKYFKIQNSAKKPIKLKWVRLSQIQQFKNRMVFMDKVQAININQGLIGDCYFLSSVASLTKLPFRITQLFDKLEVNPKGLYMAKLVFKGVLQEVIVDDYFPIDVQTNQIIGCTMSCRNNYELYPLILEKCWAKLWGSFEKIDSTTYYYTGGYPHQALFALTGAITKNYFLQKQTKLTKEESVNNQDSKLTNHEKSQLFYDKIFYYHKLGYLLCTTTGGQKQPKTIPLQNGNRRFVIQINHAYAIKSIGTDETKRKIVSLYNPWGFNRVLKTEKSNNQFQNVSGQFNLQWQDYIKSYNYLTVCKIRDLAHYVYIQLQNCRRNQLKFIQLSVKKSTQGYFGICLSETDRKQQLNIKYITVTFLVVKVIETLQKQVIYEPFEHKIKTQYSFSNHYLQLIGVKPGKYIIACFFTQIDIKESLTFSVYSQEQFGIKQVNNIHQKQFLNQNLRIHAKNKYEKRQIIEQDEHAWIFYHIIPKTSLGYIVTHVGKNAKSKKLIMEISKQQFEQIDLCFYEPYSKSQVVTMQTGRGQQGIIVLVVSNIARYIQSDVQSLQKYKKRIHETINIKAKLIK